MPEQPIHVAVSLDVEEEGLFRGSYACRNLSLTNLARLERLRTFIERGVKPTLFCAYSVLANDSSRRHLERLLPYVEIGAHLHYWNTPPLPENAPAALTAVPARKLSTDLFAAKLQNILTAAKAFSGQTPKSFRMGRWDMYPHFFPVLAAYGVKVDASLRPLHNLEPAGPNHFACPADPHIIPTPHGKILEVPLTVVPIWRPLAQLPAPLNRSLRHWGALALLPVEHPLWLMRLTTQLHLAHGGTTLSLAWHSSEMFPGGNPRLPTEQSVNAFLTKVQAYLDWLEHHHKIIYANMSAMSETISADQAPAGETPQHA